MDTYRKHGLKQRTRIGNRSGRKPVESMKKTKICEQARIDRVEGGLTKRSVDKRKKEERGQ